MTGALGALLTYALLALLWGANYGLLSEAYKILSSPLFLTAVKLLNVGVACVVLVLLVRRWVPAELARRAAQRDDEAKLRRELEASLRAVRESEERFRLVALASRDAIWDWDLRTGAVLNSPRVPEMMGFEPNDWEPTMAPWKRILHPDDAARVLDYAERFIQGEFPTYDVRYRALHRDGRALHLHGSAVLVKDAAGAPARLVGFTRDVTDEVAAETARVQSQKLESLGLLAGGIAHDFNNILTVLSASLSLAERQVQTGPLRDTLGTATLAVDRAALLTRQLLAYAGRGRLTQRSVDLNDLVKAMSALLTVSVRPGVQLHLALAPNLPLVRGDEGPLQQVVMNLVTNAAEAVGEQGGTVTLTTRAATLDAQPADLVTPAPLGPVVLVEVSDTGPGMPPEVKSRIFDPFYSTKGTGRGLGLSALAGILRVHTGAVALKSAPGQGTTFTIYLPALPPSAKVVRRPPPGAAGPRLEARVLLVDDEPLLRRTARRLLELMGCQVDEACTGLEAVQLVQAAPTAWDLALMDVTMPQMDGYEATRRIAVIAPALRVVLSSGYTALEDAETLPSGVRTLPKPYDAHRLEAMIREVMASRP